MKTQTENDTDKTLAGCGYALLLLLISPVSLVWKGYVFSVLWRWFVVPTFDARPLGIAASIGLTYVAGMLTYHYRRTPKDDRDETEKFVEVLIFSLLSPAFSLGFGAIVNHWM